MDAIEDSELLEHINVESLQEHISTFIDLFIMLASKIVIAVVVLWISLWMVKRLIGMVDASMSKRNVEVTLHKFLLNILSLGLKAIAIIIFASMLGVETASLVALLGAAGLAVGLALQGSLANFAGGIIILFFRPFKAGDVIEAQGFIGRIEEIQIFNTILVTFDNRKIFIPNGLLSNGCLVNDFAMRTRRVDMKFGVSYNDSIAHVREVVQKVLTAEERILKSPAPDIFVGEHGADSVNFFVRPWCRSEDYWEVYFAVHEQLKLAFDNEGISIPFPQRDVHFYPAEKASD
ncbi:mechanosensitive ion channel [Thalassotalea sp. HSM 43]|uniref:mechanosensitive ion channel family protein n=1 Tax=Thalassotalea sp. HSM 43 TaxID=2552945 RepID=UPI001081C369|nr:mechanosensitive ion channel domain-containing protein [Thalassotalea sp. HSM 43]QBY04125.1 mechanosensitive ion channel [Thalassotalea sp. HSM 43]